MEGMLEEGAWVRNLAKVAPPLSRSRAGYPSKMATKRLPPIHPGEILREEFLTPLRMSAHQLALALRVPATRLNDVVNEKRGITADTALRLSRYFGTTSRFWMNMQTSYELEMAEDKLGAAVRREVLPRQKCDVGDAG
jgi:addiction module HigA family antidote